MGSFTQINQKNLYSVQKPPMESETAYPRIIES